MRSLKRSKQHFEKAVTRLPLGVSSNFRYWGDERTIYARRGKGGRIWDIDDNEYIDYRLAYGPVILGYADARVDAAAREGMEIGGVFALSTEAEYELAGRICRMVPGAEKVRLSNSGTEAVMAALRVARAHTGKDGHIVLEGGYHGIFSEVMWYSELEDWDPDQGEPEVLPYGDGVPRVTKRLFHTAQRCGCDRGSLEETPRPHRCVPDRTDHGQLLRHPGAQAIPARRARTLRPLRGAADRRRGQDGFSRGKRRGAGIVRYTRRSLYVREGTRQRLPDRRFSGQRRGDAPDRRRRRTRRHVHGALGIACSRQQDARDTRRNRCPADNRKLWSGSPGGNQWHPDGAWYSTQLYRAPGADGSVFLRRGPDRLPRLGRVGLRVLRCARTRVARSRCAGRAGFARAVVPLRGAQRRLS